MSGVCIVRLNGLEPETCVTDNPSQFQLDGVRVVLPEEGPVVFEATDGYIVARIEIEPEERSGAFEAIVPTRPFKEARAKAGKTGALTISVHDGKVCLAVPNGEGSARYETRWTADVVDGVFPDTQKIFDLGGEVLAKVNLNPKLLWRLANAITDAKKKNNAWRGDPRVTLAVTSGAGLSPVCVKGVPGARGAIMPIEDKD